MDAWHFKYGHSLREKDTWRLCTSPDIQKPSSTLARQPVTYSVMPMVFNEIPRIEKEQCSRGSFHVPKQLVESSSPLKTDKDCLILEIDWILSLF